MPEIPMERGDEFPVTECAKRIDKALDQLSLLEGSDSSALVVRLLTAALELIQAAIACLLGR
jgi:hypothetical protein